VARCSATCRRKRAIVHSVFRCWKASRKPHEQRAFEPRKEERAKGRSERSVAVSNGESTGDIDKVDAFGHATGKTGVEGANL
jgi:hypothetical protein